MISAISTVIYYYCHYCYLFERLIQLYSRPREDPLKRLFSIGHFRASFTISVREFLPGQLAVSPPRSSHSRELFLACRLSKRGVWVSELGSTSQTSAPVRVREFRSLRGDPRLRH